MAQIKITQIKSRINAPKVQKLTLDALGLRKMNHSVIKGLYLKSLGNSTVAEYFNQSVL